MTIQTKPERRSKYCTVEQTDSLIVLHRPYQPVNGAPQQPLQFEKLLPISEKPLPLPTQSSSPKKTEKISLHVRNEHDFAHIGIYFKENADEGPEKPADARRSRYNDSGDIEKEFRDILAERRSCLVGRDLTPMRRFLSELGPWHSLGRRDS
jgi:hypothetical protein